MPKIYEDIAKVDKNSKHPQMRTRFELDSLQLIHCFLSSDDKIVYNCKKMDLFYA
jgi:hypothetical protein